MQQEEVIIIGAGPCGLAAAIALKQIGKNPLVIEKGNVVNSIYHFPTHQTFFSTSDNLEIGDVPFVTEEHKPKRNHALAYYREVVKRKKLRINTFEKVTEVTKSNNELYCIVTDKQKYLTPNVIIATGYYDSPNFLNVPGENLPKVSHYFKEAHPYFDKDVVIVGGKNSSVEAAMELSMAGARVTVIYRGKEYSKSIKPWILPEFDSFIRNQKIAMEFNATIKEISEKKVVYFVENKEKELENDYVLAMTGYHPDHNFLKNIGIDIDEETGRPNYNPETMETNLPGVFIAGVMAAGNNANEIFIENGRLHGEQIAQSLVKN
jgi:thioredoxin reductase (NADPH)